MYQTINRLMYNDYRSTRLYRHVMTVNIQGITRAIDDASIIRQQGVIIMTHRLEAPAHLLLLLIHVADVYAHVLVLLLVYE